MPRRNSESMVPKNAGSHMVPATGIREIAMEQERLEQLRYVFLAKLYLLTGSDCTYIVTPREMETLLETPAEAYLPLIEELVRLGYVRRAGRGGAVAITEKGIEYMQTGAWRRRSLRG
jgi:hypothetical protein